MNPQEIQEQLQDHQEFNMKLDNLVRERFEEFWPGSQLPIICSERAGRKILFIV